ncbi:MAG TPA: SRPBCC domain-containing protein [Vicinamibacterales bacterium]
MPDILQDFPIKANRSKVFEMFTTPSGLDAWWTMRSAGHPAEGAEYELFFGPEYDWRARVTKCVPDEEFELEMTRADADWTGSRVGVRLESRGDATRVQFRHLGWQEANAHYRTSCHCWALYLRVLRRYLENGETVPYDDRLDV